MEEVNDFSYGYTDIAISESGKIFLINPEKLLAIDANTWEIEFVADYDYLEFNSLIALDNEWLLAATSSGKLYKIQMETGLIIELGTLNFVPNGDIAFLQGHYYLSVLNGQLARFDFDENSNQISNQQVIGELSFTMGKLYGLTTLGKATCNSNDLELIGFDGSYVYKIDPETANCNVICTSLSMPGGVMGATSITDIQSQMLYAQMKVEIPNIFTPNNDGINDFFESPEMIWGISNCSISIFNRWGNLVFTDKEKDYFLWNGRTNTGEQCNEGIYYYKISLEGYCDDEKTELNGFLQLIK